MSDHYAIAIIGSGPAGLSACANAIKQGLSCILLEAQPQFANTVQHYQKGKWVMDEPAVLPLRSDLPFHANTREAVLDTWQEHITEQQLNIHYNAEVTAISGQKGNFALHLKADNDETIIYAEQVILSIGIQGNLRQLSAQICDPEISIATRSSDKQRPLVEYQLDDPLAFEGETILVIGAGDSAIENALALAEQNQVLLINRRGEFTRAKQANNDAILQAISQEKLECHYSTRPVSIIPHPHDGNAIQATLKTPEGQAKITCDRVIARLGATPPRAFLEACGIGFPDDNKASAPILNGHYESTVPGLYLIGAVAAYPLIKQALNQGYEVIEFILGHDIAPADEPLLIEKFRRLPAFHSVDTTLDMIRLNMPLLSGLTNPQLREFLRTSEVHYPEPGEVIFKYNDYSNTFFSIIYGEVRISVNREDASQIVTLRQGQFFGELGLISGRRRTSTVYAGSGQQCVLIETPRPTMLKLINASPVAKAQIDQIFVLRAIQTSIAPEIPASDLAAVVYSSRIESYAPGDVIFREGDPGDCLHLIRSGSVTVSRENAGNEVVSSYVAAGNYVGETALLSNSPRSVTVRAAVATETVRLDGTAFMALLDKSPALRKRLETRFRTNLAQQTMAESQPQTGNMISFLVAQGLGEASDVLLIDESLCIHCNNCEVACAATHEGTSRLDREAGPTFASLHVPTSCRHCEHPRCMKDCPPDAIHRADNGEVYIADNCIGCGNCEKNCPYGVIQMTGKKQKHTSLWLRLLFGVEYAKIEAVGEPKAVKCDMCKDLHTGPACVRACPTGAALRASPEQFMERQ
ncbi:cyclic nucleotide-binding domain-containing protein [Candidatus Venteria ishoeyi]|uniref:Hydrogenase-4 component A n=1 Tax=Candidatus Venteria ishoeyi TaxID=1899563 RepID=A0A1H6FAC1_9GAMM|nr:cyclic nucleotide-binding domain-containing protein [Candidatus Venteria ishoeyi]MDM8545276.1 cyclic nucleotide-binding domain-containing protein [Candidatus Venteria ishoeyi]SEH07060.1 Hydrogenase-4 component A [Candidatus Venteria ishoeyi]